MEEWNGKKKEQDNLKEDDLNKEMEDSLMEKDSKRKDVEPVKGRQSKRRKLAKLEGWGEPKPEEDDSLPEGWKQTGEILPEEWKPDQEGTKRMETMKMDNKPGEVVGVILQMGSRQDTTSAVPDKSPIEDECLLKEWKQADETLPEGWKANTPEEWSPGQLPSMMSMTQPSTSFQPHLVPEGFVRIGLVPLRESQLPVTPVGILAVRGERGRG